MYKTIFDAIRAKDINAGKGFLDSQVDLSLVEQGENHTGFDLAAELNVDEIVGSTV